MKRELVCIVCPNGCRCTARSTRAGLVVHGHSCPRGEQYAREEITDPRRTVTCVVRTGDPAHPCVPVKTDRPLPKKLIGRLLREIYSREAPLPVRCGGVLLRDFAGSGVDVVFTRSIPVHGRKRKK